LENSKKIDPMKTNLDRIDDLRFNLPNLFSLSDIPWCTPLLTIPTHMLCCEEDVQIIQKIIYKLLTEELPNRSDGTVMDRHVLFSEVYIYLTKHRDTPAHCKFVEVLEEEIKKHNTVTNLPKMMDGVKHIFEEIIHKINAQKTRIKAAEKEEEERKKKSEAGVSLGIKDSDDALVVFESPSSPTENLKKLESIDEIEDDMDDANTDSNSKMISKIIGKSETDSDVLEIEESGKKNGKNGKKGENGKNGRSINGKKNINGKNGTKSNKKHSKMSYMDKLRKECQAGKNFKELPSIMPQSLYDLFKISSTRPKDGERLDFFGRREIPVDKQHNHQGLLYAHLEEKENEGDKMEDNNDKLMAKNNNKGEIDKNSDKLSAGKIRENRDHRDKEFRENRGHRDYKKSYEDRKRDRRGEDDKKIAGLTSGIVLPEKDRKRVSPHVREPSPSGYKMKKRF